MHERKKLRYTLSFLVLIGLTIVLLIWNLVSGSSVMSVQDAFSALTGKNADPTAQSILLHIRFPRMLAALLLGGALSVSGFLLQCFFGNPIAGPFVLGISSGAKLAVALLMVYSLQRGLVLHSFWMILASLVGSVAATAWIIAVSGKIRNMSLLIVAGVMTGYICSAVTELVVAFADDANIVNLHNWAQGSFSGTDWSDVRAIAVTVLVTTVLVFLLSKPMGAYQLGETYAENMGVNVKRFRVLLILLSSILSACVTAFAGPVSFVGVAVPHLMKRLFGTARPLLMIPACFLGGGVFCLFCDLLARMLFSPVELSISTVTAVFGAPVVVWMMLRRQEGRV
ncbi:MAG: iron ABC transporter permease [Oscillospiraceae bacterium]|nr:iron ABC transporter permease [Oscillospiraceae bacterium]